MTNEDRKLAITYLEEMKEKYIEGYGYERHPLPEYYAIETALEALEEEPILDKIRAEIMSKDGLEEALEIIDKHRAAKPSNSLTAEVEDREY